MRSKIKTAVILCSVLTSAVYAQLPPPHLRLSFEKEFHLEGTGAEALTHFPGSPFRGIEDIPAGQFVEGITGRGFIPAADIKIQGTNVVPAPEGTISIWIKPVNYEEDWVAGPALTSGRIGGFFSIPPWQLKAEDRMGYASMTLRINRHDCCSGFMWLENWNKEPLHRNYSYEGPNPVFAIWQKDKWRMLTVVWSRGERRIYFNGVRTHHGTEVAHNPTIPGETIIIPAGSKVADELTIWDAALTDAQVAALFYSRMERSGLSGTSQEIPALQGDIILGTDSTLWAKAVKSTSWTDAYSGMAAESKPYSEEKDILLLGHREGRLYIRYREPMPKNYIEISTLLGADGMLRRRATGRDSDVWQDDSLEVHLSPDGGATRYILAAGAGGALYDSKNGDKCFNLSPEDWRVDLNESSEYWTVDMDINLASLSGGPVPGEWAFNLVRTVRQQGYARRQWSFNAGDASRYGKIRLIEDKGAPVLPDMEWSETTGKLQLRAEGLSDNPLNITYGITPLNFLELFPEEKIDTTSGYRIDIHGMFEKTERLANLPPAQEKSELISAGEISWKGEMDYLGEELALAYITVTDENGRQLSRRNALISGSEAVSMRTFNLPSLRQLVLQVFLASETLAGEDVICDIELTEKETDEIILQAQIRGFSGIMEELPIDVSSVPVGPYNVNISVSKAGSLLGSAQSYWFKSGDPVWLDNDIGVIKSVPEPWTPVRYERDTIKVWGREHSFHHSLLPASMKVLDEDILAGPMRLIIKSGGGVIDTAEAATPSVVVDEAGIMAVIKGRTAGEHLIVEMEAELEFDGFGYFTFTLKPVDPGRPAEVESITFEVPFKKEYARLYDDSGYNGFTTLSGPIPEEGMAIPAPAAIRVGDTGRGVQFYPVLKSMGSRHTKTPLSFVPEGDTMVMRYVVSEGLTVTEPVENIIGLIGTPVKPYDAERIRKTGQSFGRVDEELKEKGYSSTYFWFSTWTNYGGGTEPESAYFNYSPEWREGFVNSLKNDWEEKSHYGLLKIQPALITVHSPEYALFWKEWGGRYFEGLEELVIDLSEYKGADIRPPGVWTGVDWTNESWQDFTFYSLDKVLRSFAEQNQRVGIYVDCTHHHGDPRPYRRWVQRLYSITRQHSPEGLLAIHMSGDRKMAIWGMVDVIIEGEQYSAGWGAHMGNNPGLNSNDCFPTVLPLERTRATYASSLWGPQPVFLSQLWTCSRQGEDILRRETGDPGPTYYRRKRHITGLLLVHEAYFWGEFYACGIKDTLYPWIRRAKWGYDETVQFIPYWDNNGMIEVESPDNEKIVASGWLRPDGNLMLIVFNDTDSDVDVRVKVSPEKFPVKLMEFTQAEDITSPVPSLEPEVAEPHRYRYENNVLKLDMRARDFRLLILE